MNHHTVMNNNENKKQKVLFLKKHFRFIIPSLLFLVIFCFTIKKSIFIWKDFFIIVLFFLSPITLYCSIRGTILFIHHCRFNFLLILFLLLYILGILTSVFWLYSFIGFFLFMKPINLN